MDPGESGRLEPLDGYRKRGGQSWDCREWWERGTKCQLERRKNQQTLLVRICLIFGAKQQGLGVFPPNNISVSLTHDKRAVEPGRVERRRGRTTTPSFYPLRFPRSLSCHFDWLALRRQIFPSSPREASQMISWLAMDSRIAFLSWLSPSPSRDMRTVAASVKKKRNS